MPLVTVKVIEDVFTPEQKHEMIRRITDTIVEIEGENLRPVTWVVVEEVRRGSRPAHRARGSSGHIRGGQASGAGRRPSALVRGGFRERRHVSLTPWCIATPAITMPMPTASWTLRTWPSTIAPMTVDRQNAAYRNFFASITGQRKGSKVAAPRFRSRKDSRQVIRFTASTSD